MIRSVAFGLLAGAIAVLVIYATRPPPPIAATFSTATDSPMSPTTHDVGAGEETVGTLQLQTRIYRVDDLMVALAARTELLAEHMNTAVTDERRTATAPEMADAIIKFIEDIVESDTWRDNGGTIGGIREIGGLLIVTHTPAAHQQIRQFLDQLREAAAAPATRPTGGSR